MKTYRNHMLILCIGVLLLTIGCSQQIEEQEVNEVQEENDEFTQAIVKELYKDFDVETTPIFDRDSNHVAYILDNNIYGIQGGLAKAYILDDNVFGMSNRYLGTYVDGYFRDKQGKAVGFIKGAARTSLPPLSRIPVIPPNPATPVLGPNVPGEVVDRPPGIPMNSDFSWLEYLNQD